MEINGNGSIVTRKSKDQFISRVFRQFQLFIDFSGKPLQVWSLILKSKTFCNETTTKTFGFGPRHLGEEPT